MGLRSLGGEHKFCFSFSFSCCFLVFLNFFGTQLVIKQAQAAAA